MKKMKKDDSPREFSKVSIGFRFGVNQATDGTYSWFVRQFKKQLATGTAATKKRADKDMQAAMARVITAASRTSGNRAALRSKLTSMIQSRPYIAHWVLDSLAQADLPRTQICDEAEDQEKSRWEEDTGAGKAPLPTHHRTKPAADVAGAMWDCCQQLGVVGTKAFKLGSDLLGVGFSNPDADSYKEVSSLKPREKAAEDEAETEEVPS